MFSKLFTIVVDMLAILQWIVVKSGLL